MSNIFLKNFKLQNFYLRIKLKINFKLLNDGKR